MSNLNGASATGWRDRERYIEGGRLRLGGGWKAAHAHMQLIKELVSDLVCGVVVLLQVRVSQRLLHLDPLVRVKGQHLVQQVQSCSMTRRSPNE